jgi:hypothetical protein
MVQKELDFDASIRREALLQGVQEEFQQARWDDFNEEMAMSQIPNPRSMQYPTRIAGPINP